MALTSFDPPLIPPSLPAEITHIWLLSEAEQADEFVIWRASAKEPWRRLRVKVPNGEKLNCCLWLRQGRLDIFFPAITRGIPCKSGTTRKSSHIVGSTNSNTISRME